MTVIFKILRQPQAKIPTCIVELKPLRLIKGLEDQHLKNMRPLMIHSILELLERFVSHPVKSHRISLIDLIKLKLPKGVQQAWPNINLLGRMLMP